jgi:hypothetical protein
MSMAKKTDWSHLESRLIGKIEARCHMGMELHTMTSKGFNTRILNIRLYRVVPNFSGHTGYTKQGVMLSKEEVQELHSHLTEALANDSLWDDQETSGVVPIE